MTEDNGAQDRGRINSDLDKQESNEDSSFTKRETRIKSTDPIKSPAFLSLKAYKRMVGYGTRYASNDLLSREWREVYGILIGSIDKNNMVIIKDAIPMVVGDRAGVKYENKQYVDMAQIDASIYERSIQNKKSDFIIGWWHTHPGYGFFYSNVDNLTQLGYQSVNSHAIGLIFDHCELESRDFYLGVAGLRLSTPERGILSRYRYVELDYELDRELMVKKVEKVRKKIQKNIARVKKDLDYIDDILRKRALAQLQRNFGLILVPRQDVKVTANEEEAIEDERFLYEWDPEFFKKSYRIPKFRSKIENEIKKTEEILRREIEEDNLEKVNHKKAKLQKKLQNKLKRPEEIINRIMVEFTKKLESIFPYFDYLDTDERKKIELFEQRSTDYFRILNHLKSRIEFKI